ncbi:hypothetical protein GCM10012279_09950 [Micromonospora yangpuensis]|nr:hypothetical protein GCM10012279_09950 [Micromonospora yangpuensis]
MAARTFSRVAAEIGRAPVSTYDTVLTETWARRATSCMFAIAHLPVRPATGPVGPAPDHLSKRFVEAFRQKLGHVLPGRQ